MTMVSQSEIKVECGAALDPEGVFQFVYIGDSDEPAIEGTIAWDDMINGLIQERCVALTDAIVVSLGNEFAKYGGTDGVLELMEYVDTLRDTANRLEDRIRSGKIFIRERWAKAGQNTGSIDDYCVSYEEYLEYVWGNSDES